MKYPLAIILLMLLSSCGVVSSTDGVVEIRGYQGAREVVWGMGVCIGEDQVLTSAHVVREDRLSYVVGDISTEYSSVRYVVGERDFVTDMAYMKVKNEEGKMKNICKSYKEYIGKTEALKIGESISIPVIRSGSLVTLTGSITSLTGSRIAYDSVGRTQVLSGLIVTDISLLPGDSGAPILDRQGRVIDVVHVAE